MTRAWAGLLQGQSWVALSFASASVALPAVGREVAADSNGDSNQRGRMLPDEAPRTYKREVQGFGAAVRYVADVL